MSAIDINLLLLVMAFIAADQGRVLSRKNVLVTIACLALAVIFVMTAIFRHVTGGLSPWLIVILMCVTALVYGVRYLPLGDGRVSGRISNLASAAKVITAVLVLLYVAYWIYVVV